MADVLIRGVDEELLARLKESARVHGRSLQAEIHHILADATEPGIEKTRRLSARWLRRLEASRHSDSAALIREDRNR